MRCNNDGKADDITLPYDNTGQYFSIGIEYNAIKFPERTCAREPNYNYKRKAANVHQKNKNR